MSELEKRLESMSDSQLEIDRRAGERIRDLLAERDALRVKLTTLQIAGKSCCYENKRQLERVQPLIHALKAWRDNIVACSDSDLLRALAEWEAGG